MVEAAKSTVATTGIDFTPDAEFDKRMSGGEGSSTTIKDFLHNYDRVKLEEGDAEAIGKAVLGLYWNEDGTASLTEKDGSEEIIDTTMELGESGKGQLLTLCESGIANTVRELADDEDNHLPNTKTGVVVHYVTEGIARDFGITFNRMPVSLGGGRGRGASRSDRDAGKRGLSKKEKNKLLQQMELSYYEDAIKSGEITEAEAFAKMSEAFATKRQLESEGYYLSPNKTEGVLLYNWKEYVDNAWKGKPKNRLGYTNGSRLYTSNKIEVVLPDIYGNYFDDDKSKANKVNTRHLLKSSLAQSCLAQAARFGIKGFSIGQEVEGTYQEKYRSENKGKLRDGDRGGFEVDTEITSQQDILNIIGFNKKGTVMGVHLAKLKQPGMMKPRYVVVDVMDGNEQKLYLFHNSETMTFDK